MGFEAKDLAVHLLPRNQDEEGLGCTPSPHGQPGCTPSPPQNPPGCTPSPEPTGKPKPAGAADQLPLGLLRQHLRDALTQPGAR